MGGKGGRNGKELEREGGIRRYREWSGNMKGLSLPIFQIPVTHKSKHLYLHHVIGVRV